MASSRPVRIELRSAWDGERIEQQFDGEMYEKRHAVYLRYTETDEQAGETRTIVKLTEREIDITRRGHVESEQRFARNERRKGRYRTEMGVLPIMTETLQMDMRLEHGLGVVAWSYSLYIADEPAGLFHLQLTIREGSV